MLSFHHLQGTAAPVPTDGSVTGRLCGHGIYRSLVHVATGCGSYRRNTGRWRCLVFCISLFVGIISYANALVAQYFGAGQHKKSPRVVTQGAIMVVVSLPVLAIATYFVGDLFGAIGHDPSQVKLERVYFYILMSGSLFTLLKICIASYFSGIGRSKVVMTSDVAGMLLNVPLSYALIFGKAGLPTMSSASVRTVLYMAVLSAIQHNPIIRDFYERLVSKGKHSKVALTACMRKMITILNAMVRDNTTWEQNYAK